MYLAELSAQWMDHEIVISLLSFFYFVFNKKLGPVFFLLFYAFEWLFIFPYQVKTKTIFNAYLTLKFPQHQSSWNIWMKLMFAFEHLLLQKTSFTSTSISKQFLAWICEKGNVFHFGCRLMMCFRAWKSKEFVGCILKGLTLVSLPLFHLFLLMPPRENTNFVTILFSS